jgi:hypothetical protein
MASTYQLVRVTPQGQEKTQRPFPTTRKAATAAFYVLTDNGVTTKKDANDFAGRLHTAALGTELVHESGYKFRIELEAS